MSFVGPFDSTLVVFTDGRDYIYDTIPSAAASLRGPITRRIIYDDSGDPLNRDRLATAFPTFTVAHSPDGRLGFGGAIRFMWNYLATHDENPYIFHLEDDFLFNDEVDVGAMCGLLTEHPSLVQVALRRQACNADERAAGGVIEVDPEAFAGCEWKSHKYEIHRKFWTTNPSVYRRSLCSRGWPNDPYSEGKFGAIIRDESVASPFAYWGSRRDEPLVTHVGVERAGVGY